MNDEEVIIRLRQLMSACDTASFALNRAFSIKLEPYAQAARTSTTKAANDVYKLLSLYEKEKDSCTNDP